MKEERKKQLLFSVTKDDCDWEYFKAPGPGGQRKNKVMSAVRCRHRASGAVAEATDSRSQADNKVAAFTRMAETKKFKNWHRAETARRVAGYKSIEEMAEKAVDKAMAPGNIKVEGRDSNEKWVDLDKIEVVMQSGD